jgi:hypothetical protein
MNVPKGAIVAAAAVIVLAIIIRYRRKAARRSGFALANPARVWQAETSSAVRRNLKKIADSGDNFLELTKDSDPLLLTAKPVLEEPSIADVRRNVRNLVRACRVPATSAAELYSGLADNDTMYTMTADAYSTMGHIFSQRIEQGFPGITPEMSDALLLISSEIKDLVKNVHKLGASLDLE